MSLQTRKLRLTRASALWALMGRYVRLEACAQPGTSCYVSQVLYMLHPT